MDAGSLQRDETDAWESDPVRCPKNALWMSNDKDSPFAVLTAPPVLNVFPFRGSQRCSDLSKQI
jgi:hypothetical protein